MGLEKFDCFSEIREKGALRPVNGRIKFQLKFGPGVLDQVELLVDLGLLGGLVDDFGDLGRWGIRG